MKLKDFLQENEEVREGQRKTELICEFLPGADWYLFKTSIGRFFTCKDESLLETNIGKNWVEVEFDSIVEGRAYPF